MDNVALMAAGAFLSIIVRTWSGAGRGAVLTLAVALLFGAYSPAASAVSAAPVGVLNLAIGLVGAGAIGSPRLATAPRRQSILVLTLAYYGLALVVTAAAAPTGIGAVCQFAVLAVGSLMTARSSTPGERHSFRRGVVGVAALESVAALWELTVRGRPGFWDYTALSDAPGGLQLPNPILGDEFLRMAGTTGHPLVLGFLATVAIAVVAAAPQVFPNRVVRWGILALLAGGQLAAGNRSTLLATAVLALYLTVTSRSVHRAWKRTAAVVAATFGGVQTAAFVSEQVTALLGSGSFTNRSGNLAAAPDLIVGRPAIEVAFGTGWDTEQQLFDRGFLNQNGFDIVDNQFVTTLATFGVLGLVLLIAVFVAAWRSRSRSTRTVVLVVITLAFSFDYLRWASVVVLVFGLLPQDDDAPVESDAPLPTPTRIGVHA